MGLDSCYNQLGVSNPAPTKRAFVATAMANPDAIAKMYPNPDGRDGKWRRFKSAPALSMLAFNFRKVFSQRNVTKTCLNISPVCRGDI